MKKYKTKQEIFNIVWDKLTEQGRPSVNGDGSCLYDGPDGTHCAIGWLIDAPDETSFWCFPDSVWKQANIDPTLAGLTGRFLEDLRGAHDDAAEDAADFVSELHRRLRKLAQKYKLKVPK